MARALRAWAIKGRKKLGPYILAYGPRTRLTRGIYTIADNFKLIQAKQQFSFILLVYCTHARNLLSRFVAAVSSNAINLKSSVVKSCVSVVAFKILPSKH